jgi:hypothetical protein
MFHSRENSSLEHNQHEAVCVDEDSLPIARIPPVGIEMAICKASDFCKGTKNIFEDDQEDKEKGDHERKQKHADRLT